MGCSFACYVHNNMAVCVCKDGQEVDANDNTACVPIEVNPCDAAGCSHGCHVDGSGDAVCSCPVDQKYILVGDTECQPDPDAAVQECENEGDDDDDDESETPAP